jgi:heptosyltransferase-3
MSRALDSRLEGLRRLRAWCLRALLSLAGRAWKPGPAAAVERIVILEMTRLGDLVAASALFDPLRAAFPGAALELVGAADYAPLFDGAQVRFHGLPARGLAFCTGLLSLRAVLKGPGVLVVAASPAVRNSLLVLASSPGRACGYLFPEAGGLDYDAGAPLRSLGGAWDGRARLPAGSHMVDRAARVLGVAGLPAGGVSPKLGSSVPRIPGKVLLHAGANWDRRRWPLDRFVALARALAARKYAVTLIPAEAGPVYPEPGLRILDGPGLKALRDELASASLFIGNDSGPMHLAAALGTPCLALFGPNLVERSGPWPLPGPLSPHRALWEDVPCRPCDQLRCVQPWRWCMDLLPLQRVEHEAQNLLNSIPQG